MDTVATAGLTGTALEAWRSYLQSHASIVRELDGELVIDHGMTSRDYEVLLYLAQAENRKLPMSALSERTMLTRSGITRLIDGLVACGLIERVSCESDARVSYAQLTDTGYEKLRAAGQTHIAGIRRLFLEHFTEDEIDTLASLLSRLPGAAPGGSCSIDDAEPGCAVSDADDPAARSTSAAIPAARSGSRRVRGSLARRRALVPRAPARPPSARRRGLPSARR